MACRENKLKQLSNEELCACLSSQNCTDIKNADLLPEIDKRIEIRYDSTVGNIDYHTIIKKPSCASDYIEASHNNKQSIAWTKPYIKEKKLLNPLVRNTLNGDVMYQYHRDKNGNLVKDYIYLPTNNKEGNCAIYFNNDTLRVGERLEIMFDIDTKAFWSYGLYTEVDDAKLVQGEVYEITIFDNNKEYFREELIDLNSSSDLDHYKHTIVIEELGLHEYKGILYVLMKQKSDFEKIDINFRYIVIEK